jgi:LuxR family maltose regulon positive regulatory protein
MECLNETKIRIRELLAETKRTNNIFQLIDILVLQAITFSKLLMREKAVKIMKDALNLAAPRDFIRPFIEPGDDIINLLGEVEKEGVNAGFIEDIRREFYKYNNIPIPAFNQEKTTNESSSSNLSNPLSNREKEIVSYLVKGYRNKDIADKISISPTTVKKHIYNICKKLEVHSRGEVVTKVRESGIF